MSERGKFITFEGIDGAGKSTHIEWLANWLRQRGHGVLTTREPGGTPLGEKLRALLLADDMHLETEALLMFAARREHLARVIYPALGKGTWVISDRFTDASMAYQGGGRGLDKGKLEALERWVQGDFQPDLTLLFDVSLEVAQARIATTRQLDRFEQEKRDFHQRVRQAYLERAAEHPERIQVIRGEGSLDEIKKEIEQLVASNCL